MPARSWIAVLLLINYLLVVGAGCMSRPEDQGGFVRVQTTENGHAYQECRYLRMDGLETFLADALANQYQSAPDTTKHHVISVIPGVDAHCLTPFICQLPASPDHGTLPPAMAGQSAVPPGTNHAVHSPPWLG